MYKIGIVGERGSVLGFMALGFAVREVSDAEDAAKTLHRLVKSGEYAVIYLTEDYAAQLEDRLAQYKDLPLPAVISIPGAAGSTGYGMNLIRSAVERAVGADILFGENG